MLIFCEMWLRKVWRLVLFVVVVVVVVDPIMSMETSFLRVCGKRERKPLNDDDDDDVEERERRERRS